MNTPEKLRNIGPKSAARLTIQPYSPMCSVKAPM